MTDPLDHVHPHAGQDLLAQVAEDILQQYTGQRDQAHIDQYPRLAGSLDEIMHIVIKGILEIAGRKVKSGQGCDHRCLFRLEQDVEERYQHGKVHQSEDDEKEDIDNILRDIVMIGLGKTQEAKKNFHVLLQFRLKGAKLS